MAMLDGGRERGLGHVVGIVGVGDEPAGESPKPRGVGGQKIVEGTFEQVRESPALLEAYLGRRGARA